MFRTSLEPLRLDITALTTDPYDVEMIREHCHVDGIPGSFDEANTLLYMRSAIAWAEGEMHRTIFSRTHAWVLRAFPLDGRYQEIQLPRGKTQSVENIQYSTGGNIITLTGPSASPPGTDFAQDLRGDDGGVIMPPYNGSWQGSDLNVPAPVVINFTAGWATASVPADITHALLFYVSDCYEMRGTVDVDNGQYADLRSQLISGYALHRFYGPADLRYSQW